MIKIGCKYKDVLTGFEGVATGYVHYITGCNQALIQPHCYETNKLPSPEWIDEQRLEQVGEEVAELPDVDDDAGAPSARVVMGGDREAPKR